MAAKQSWSLEQRLRRRLLIVILFVGTLTAGIVAIHYGSDVTDLHQRQVLEMAETLAADFEESIAEQGTFNPDLVSKDWIYNRYPNAYGWKILDDQENVISVSGFDWRRFINEGAEGVDEWTLETNAGVWIAGKEFDCGGGAECRVMTAVAADPANRFYRLILGEVAVHVLLPLIPFAVLGTWAITGVVRQTLRPVGEISRQARNVSEFRDIRPLTVENPPEEVVELVNALNGSLDRLAVAMERERAFLLDASHTLRTPLAALKARLQQDGGPVDLDKLRQDTDALIRLSTQLLAHANADRLRVFPGRRTDISELIIEVVSRLEPLAWQAGVDLGCEGCDVPVWAEADPDALSIALVNLIENAIEHSPRQGAVTVKLSQAPLSISVVDEGGGVPEPKIPEITKRFTRESQNRGHGAGLGLSIVEQIMRAHGGSLRLRNNESPGLTASLVFGNPGAH